MMGGHHGAICALSRAMLISGKSLFRVYYKLEGDHTMPMHFAENGYETFGTGKWHNRAETFEASFQKGENAFIGGMADHYQVPCSNLVLDRKLSESIKKRFSTDLFADAAIGQFHRFFQRTRSFFLMVLQLAGSYRTLKFRKLPVRLFL